LAENHHENPALGNRKTTAVPCFKNVNIIKVSSDIGEVETLVEVTEGVVPGVSAIYFFGTNRLRT